MNFFNFPIAAANTANKKRLAYVGSKPGRKKPRDSDSWFTPAIYIDAARKTMYGIDLDPFSSEAANKSVKAARFLTVKEDAFVSSWKSRSVWMNPPYSAGLCAKAINRFLETYAAGHFSEGIILVNNCTDTKWFQAAAKQASAICFTAGRISFWNADGKATSGNTRGQAFLYYGNNVNRFMQIFNEFGITLRVNHGSM